MKKISLSVMALTLFATSPAQAFFFFIPIPNLGKPADLQRLIDTLEKSDETKAVAYVSEDKTFGTKYWVWAHQSGVYTQADADQLALTKCNLNLNNIKRRMAGEKPLYEFGNKQCELHEFTNKTVKLPPQVPMPVAIQAPSNAPQPRETSEAAVRQSAQEVKRTPAGEQPIEMRQLIESYAKANETNAIAYVAEDRPLEARAWVWNEYSGPVSQEDANRYALNRCEQSLSEAKQKAAAAGVTLEFGSKRCELHSFAWKAKPAVMSAQREKPAQTSVVFDKPADQPAIKSATIGNNTGSASANAQRLRELNNLLKEGVITKDDFEKKKSEILKSM